MSEERISHHWIVRDEGFVVDLSDTNDPALVIAVRDFIGLLSELWQFLEQPTTREQAKRAQITYRLGEMCTDLFVDAGRCAGAEAWIALAVIGCSIVECLLTLYCLKHREAVVRTRRWKRFAQFRRKHGTVMLDLLPWLELQVMIEIGEELQWFSPDLGRLNAFHESSEFKDLEGFTEMTPRQALGRLQYFRNSVHPGHMIRTGSTLDARSARNSATYVLVSLAGLFTEAQASEALEIMLPITSSLRPLVGGGGTPMVIDVATRFLPDPA